MKLTVKYRMKTIKGFHNSEVHKETEIEVKVGEGKTFDPLTLVTNQELIDKLIKKYQDESGALVTSIEITEIYQK